MIQVCDAMMGTGKTQAAIAKMNADTEHPYLFITPYLEESTRICEGCADRQFVQPSSDSMNANGSKFRDVHNLLRQRKNIASTHRLFSYFNQETANLIRVGGYRLIMDEVTEVIDDLQTGNYQQLCAWERKSNNLEVAEDGRVIWKAAGSSLPNKELANIKRWATSGNLYYENGHYNWVFPIAVLQAFDEITILTYLFHAQKLRFYLDSFQMPYTYISVRPVCEENREYTFREAAGSTSPQTWLTNCIHLLESNPNRKKSPNDIGDGLYSLSWSWYEKASAAQLKQLKTNLSSVAKNNWNGLKSDDRLWTTFKQHKDIVAGFQKGFISCNMRASNAYKDRQALAYCINVFLRPSIKTWFCRHGCSVSVTDEALYALSSMLQCIWRTAIRDRKPVYLYIPSERMRQLLKAWIEWVTGDLGQPVSQAGRDSLAYYVERALRRINVQEQGNYKFPSIPSDCLSKQNHKTGV